jgi:hypothetical protein
VEFHVTGSAGGPRKRSGRNPATAPRADPTSPTRRSTRSAASTGTTYVPPATPPLRRHSRTAADRS